MKQLFDAGEADKFSALRKKYITALVAFCVALLALAVFAVVFWKTLGRAWAQTIATICTAAIGCVCVYVVQIISLNAKKQKFVKQMTEKQPKEISVKSLTIDKNTATSGGLTFYPITAVTDDGERLLYLFEGKTIDKNTTKLLVIDKYVCGYEAENE